MSDGFYKNSLNQKLRIVGEYDDDGALKVNIVNFAELIEGQNLVTFYTENGSIDSTRVVSQGGFDIVFRGDAGDEIILKDGGGLELQNGVKLIDGSQVLQGLLDINGASGDLELTSSTGRKILIDGNAENEINGGTKLTLSRGSSAQAIDLSDAEMVVIDTTNEIGLVYDADYSTNGVSDDRWIPDFGAVKSQIGGNDLDALVITPTVTEDGFVIAWNDTNDEYELIQAATMDQLGGQDLDSTVTAPTGTEDGFHLAWNESNNEYELVDDGSVAVYGTEFQEASAEAETSTTSETFQQKLRMTTPSLPAGDYRIGFYAEMRSVNSGDRYKFQVQIDDTTTISTLVIEPRHENDRFPLTGFRHETLASGVHNIDIDFAADEPSITAFILSARLEIYRTG